MRKFIIFVFLSEETKNITNDNTNNIHEQKRRKRKKKISNFSLECFERDDRTSIGCHDFAKDTLHLPNVL